MKDISYKFIYLKNFCCVEFKQIFIIQNIHQRNNIYNRNINNSIN